MSRHVVTRRSALRILGAGAGSVAVLPWLSEEGVAAFAEIQRTGAPPSLRVLSASQYATLAALTEAIIPADERSPGAKEARVADYVDLMLSEGDEKLRGEWVSGLAALDADAMTRFGAPFVRLAAPQVEAMLGEVSRNEMVSEPRTREEPSQKERPADVAAAEKPADAALNAPAAPQGKSPVEKFFITAKQATIHGYYTSEIGIHKELRYKGNQILAEFLGCLTVDGKDCPHCGRKAKA